MDLTALCKARALDLGFDLVAIAPVGPSPDYDRYVRWLEAGYAGEMGYLTRHVGLKADPRQWLPEARSLILVGLNYAQLPDLVLRADPGRGQIASYALGLDYHDVMREALIDLDGWIRARSGRSSWGRVFVDSAPLLERSWSMQAGLGFIGKNTCLIHPGFGSWLFLGGILVPEVLAYDPPPVAAARIGEGTGELLFEDKDRPAGRDNVPLFWHFVDGKTGSCGRCSRCLDICPTKALRSSYELDARLCISYLTIELRGEIPLAMRAHIGNWVFGCDLCQDVCPWNHRISVSNHPHLQPQPERLAPPLVELLALDREDFVQRFRGSAVKRAKWQGFMRNVCVAAGNWGDPVVISGLEHHLLESPPLVAAHAAWALGQLHDATAHSILQRAFERCTDHTVKGNIAQALQSST